MQRGIYQPRVSNTFPGVDTELLPAIYSLGRRRHHFANPIRREREISFAGHCRQTLSAPSGEIGNQNVLSQMQLGLVQQPPAARAITPAVKRAAELHAEHRRSMSV